MLVKDFVEGQAPSKKVPVGLFAFQRWLFAGFDGLSSFPIALYWICRNGDLVYAQTFPKWGKGRIGKAFRALLCLKLTWLGSRSVAPEKDNKPTEDSQRLPILGWMGLEMGTLSKSSLLCALGSSTVWESHWKFSEPKFFNLKSGEYVLLASWEIVVVV